MLIPYDYKKLSLGVDKCSINKFLYKKKSETPIYKRVEIEKRK